MMAHAGVGDLYGAQVLYNPTSGYDKPVMELIFETPRDVDGVTDTVIEINYPDSEGSGYLRFTISKDELYVTGTDNDGASPFLDRATGDPLYTDNDGNPLYYDSVELDATFWDTTSHTFKLGIRDTHYIDFWIDGLKKNTIYNPNLYNPSEGANILTDRAHIRITASTYDEIVWFSSYDMADGYVYVNSVPVLDSISNQAINEGDSASLNVAFSDDDSWDTFTSTIDWGDSSTSDGVVVFTPDANPANGGTGTITSSHTYADDGIYTVTVTVTDIEGGTDTSTYQVTVNELDPLVVIDNATPTLVDGRLNVDFDITIDASPDTVASIVWDFGDGTPATTDNTEDPDHYYPAHAVYTVTLTVTDDDGSDFTDTFDVVADVAVLDLTQSGPEDQGVAVDFAAVYNYPSHSAQSITWDFGDDSPDDTSNTLTPSHVYVNDATYTVTCTIVSDGRTTTETISVIINNASPPIVVIDNATPTLVDGRLNVDFDITIDASPDTVASIVWDFGDETTGTTEDPDHYYPAHAVYTVTLTVTDSEGSVYTTTFDVVADVAVLDLTQPASVDEGSSVSFTAAYYYPSHSAQSITWDFGDDSPDDTSNTLTPSHVYVNDATYTVTCTIVSDGRTTTETISVIITNIAPTVDIGSDITANEGSTISFSAAVSDVGSSDTFTYQWNLGEDSTSTEISPSKRYENDGVYTITLTVSDGTDLVSDSLILTVKNLKPYADAGKPKKGIEGYSINFEGTVSDPGDDILTIQWDFGDEQSEIGGRKISHVYVDDDIYTVTMTVTDGDGGSTSDTTTVTIDNMSPIVDAGGNLELGYNVNYQFDGSVIDKGNDIDTIVWYFGDNLGEGSTVSGSLTPTFNYGDQDGTYYGTLTVTDNDGAIGKDKFTVIIGYGQFIIQVPDDIETFEGQLNDFSVSSDFGFPIEQYNWNFGDETTETSTTRRISHSYENEGVYTVTVELVANSGNSRKSGTFIVTVLDLPTVIGTINPSPAVAYEADSVTFSSFFEDSGVNDITYFQWTIGGTKVLWGDPRTDSYNTISYEFEDNGDYEIIFRVSAEEGSVNYEEVTLLYTVNNVAPTVDFTLISQVEEGVEVQLLALATDPGPDTLLYTWAIDGVEISNAQSLSHAFLDNGVYSVSISVSDGEDITTETLSVDVLDLAPTADFNMPSSVNEGNSLSFTDTSSTGPDEIVSWMWELDVAGSSIAQNPSTTYGDDGSYTITLTVIDDDGSTSSQTKTLTVTNKNPIVTLDNNIELSEAGSTSLSGTFSDVSGDGPFTYIWTVDGVQVDSGSTSSSPISVTYNFQSAGSNAVVLLVEDKDGGQGSDTMSVYVNTPPVATVTYDSEVTEGDPASFSISITDPDVGDTYSVNWVIEGNVYTGTSTSYTFTVPGTYTVTVTVTDSYGGVYTEDVTITVVEAILDNPFEIKEGTLTVLEAIITNFGAFDFPAGYDAEGYAGAQNEVAMATERMIYYIEKSLETERWVDDYHLVSDAFVAEKVFHYEYEAEQVLSVYIAKWQNVVGLEDVIDDYETVQENLPEADRILALTHLETALSEEPINHELDIRYNNFVALAQQYYDNGIVKVAAANYQGAIVDFKTSWRNSKFAIDLVNGVQTDEEYFYIQTILDSQLPEAVGTHGNFTAQQDGMYDIFDMLTEGELVTDFSLPDSGDAVDVHDFDSLEFDILNGKTPSIIQISDNIYAIAYEGNLYAGTIITVDISSEGPIADSVVDTLVFDAVKGKTPHLIRISEDVYAIAYAGDGDDGTLKTVEISTDGTITDAAIDTLEFDTINGKTPHISYISGDIYAIVYEGDEYAGTVITVEVTTSGQITNSIVDSEIFDSVKGKTPVLIHISGDVYAVVYSGDTDDGFVKTFTISTAGLINTSGEEAIAYDYDSLEFDTLSGKTPSLIQISESVYAIAYSGDSYAGTLITVEVSSTGPITNTIIDTLEYDAVAGKTPHIISISGNTYGIAYTGDGDDGFLKTVQILTDGTIGDAVIDSLEFDTMTGKTPNITPISGNVYAIVYTGDVYAGSVVTIEVAANGQITDTVIDSDIFDTVKGNTPRLIPISGDIYAVAYSGDDDDGMLKTFTISTAGVIADEGEPEESYDFDSLEYDLLMGKTPSIIQIDDSVYAVAYAGDGDDGFLVTLDISSTGPIADSIIDSLEYDSVKGKTPDIIHVSGTTYAIAYSGDGDVGKLVSIDIQTDGSIGAAVIDSLQFVSSKGKEPSIVYVSGNVYAVAYEDDQGAGNPKPGVLSTVEILADGSIGAAVIDSLEFDAVQGKTPDIISISGEVYAIAYSGDGDDGWLKTFTISDAGIITVSLIDSWEFDTVKGKFADIVQVSGTTYAIAYQGDGDVGKLATVGILPDGSINYNEYDSLQFVSSKGKEPSIVYVSGNVYAVAYNDDQGAGNPKPGVLSTVEILADGSIGAAVIDSLEFDAVQGKSPDIISISGEVYAIAYSGVGDDGFLTTIGIEADGTITNTDTSGGVSALSAIDSLEFDAVQGKTPDIISISGEVYAIAYSGDGDDGWLKTFTISDAGIITVSLIDSWEFDAVQGKTPDLLHVSGTTYAIAYSGDGDVGKLATVGILPDGSINDNEYNTLDYDVVTGKNPNTILISGDVYAIAYAGYGDDGFLVTLNIESDGTITMTDTGGDAGAFTPIDSLEYDAVKGKTPDIISVSDDVYAIAYAGNDDDGMLITVEIATNGQITDTVIDSFEFLTAKGKEPSILHISGNVYAVAYNDDQGAGNPKPGVLSTVEILVDGSIGAAVIDSLEFDAVQGKSPDMILVSDEMHAIAYAGEGDDGFLTTIGIEADGTITNTDTSGGGDPPTYPNSVIDGYEFDTLDGKEPHIIHVSGNVYAIAYTGNDYAGTLITLEIEDDGQVTESIIDTLIYDSVKGKASFLFPISGTTYAIAYSGDDDDGFLKTVTISDAGVISDSVIDSLEFNAVKGKTPTVVPVSGDVYAIAYSGDDYVGTIITVEVATNGQITDSIIDTLVFDSVKGKEPHIIHVSGNTYAVAYSGNDYAGTVISVEIATNGQITNTLIDSLVFDSSKGKTPHIIPISGDVYAIAYQGYVERGVEPGIVSTVEITSGGSIGSSVIDSLTFDAVKGKNPDVVSLTSGVYAIAYSGVDYAGTVKNVKIADNGQITDSIIAEMVFYPIHAKEISILSVSGNVYTLAFHGLDHDGFVLGMTMGGESNYRLDLEEGWTELPSRDNAWLHIHAGDQSSETLMVDYWNGAGWTNIISDITYGWNEVDVTSYLTGSSFTIRFVDEAVTDTEQDSWGIDMVYLHVYD
jgi:PKD repeat protein